MFCVGARYKHVKDTKHRDRDVVKLGMWGGLTVAYYIPKSRDSVVLAQLRCLILCVLFHRPCEAPMGVRARVVRYVEFEEWLLFMFGFAQSYRTFVVTQQ